MTINFRYEIVKKIGSSRSFVYLVKDLKGKEKEYALKILPAENLSKDEIDSLKQEFRLLNALNHPNIIYAQEFGKVFQCDNENLIGSYFYLSEFVKGKNLLDYFSPPLDSNQLHSFLKILNQICQVLYYIHQSGIIHYDIRPENILINEDESGELNIKLIDFGFSVLKNYVVRGTPFYISPELISGEDVDYRTDLYSLGASLYHILNGNPPFSSENEVELLKKHIEEEPPPVSGKYPEFLRQIVYKLLRKKPCERFNNSLEILDFLPAEFNSIRKYWPISKIFFAYEKEFEQLKKFVENTDVVKSTALIISEPGMGKSCLINKIADYLNESEKVHFYLRISDSQAVSGNLLLELLKQVEIIINQRALENNSKLNEKISSLKNFNLEKEANLDFVQNYKNLLSEILIDLAKEINYLILIDDFQRLDRSDQSLFFCIYPSLTELNVKFIIALNIDFSRDFEAGCFHDADEILLHPLKKDEILKLLKTYFHFDFPYQEVFELLNEWTDKTVKNINEFISGLILNGILDFNAKGFFINKKKLNRLKLDNLITETISKRVETLTENQKQILNILSLADYSLKLEDLSFLTKTNIDKLKNDVIYLNSFGWVEYSSRDEMVKLPKGFIKNYLLSKTKELKELNLLLADYFDQKNFPPILTAELYERAGLISKALSFYKKAVKETENHFSFSAMEKSLVKCIELESDDQEIVHLKYKLVFSRFYQSEFQRAKILIEEIISSNYLSAEQKFNLCLTAAIINFKTGDLNSSYEYLNLASKNAEHALQRIEVELNKINLEISQGNFSEAGKKCENILNNFSEFLNNDILAAIYNNLGIVNSQTGFHQEAVLCFEKALEIYIQQKNKIKSSQVLLNLGNVYNIQGNKDKAIEYWKEALSINESIGDLAKKALILNNIGISLYESLQIEEALGYYKEAVKIFEKTNDLFDKSLSLFNMAESYFILCDYEKTILHLNESIDISKKLNDIEGQCQGSFLLGLTYFVLHKLEELKLIIDELNDLIRKNRMEPSYQHYCLYLSGLKDFEEKNISDAAKKLSLAREKFKEFENKYFYCKCTLDLMNVYSCQNSFEMAEKLLSELESSPYFQTNNLLKAEAYLILGENSGKLGSENEEKSFYYYTKAAKLIEDSYIGETTWKVLIALGDVYLEKGAINRAIELYKQAKMVIDFLLSRITNIENKNSYLTQPKRKMAVEKIEKAINKF